MNPPGSDVQDDVKKCSNCEGKSHSVAQKAANKWGIYDMLGNVYESGAMICIVGSTAI